MPDFDPKAFLAEDGNTSVPDTEAPFDPKAFLNEQPNPTDKPIPPQVPVVQFPAKTAPQKAPQAAPLVPPVDTIAPNGIQSLVQPSKVAQLLGNGWTQPNQSIGEPAPVDQHLEGTLGPDTRPLDERVSDPVSSAWLHNAERKREAVEGPIRAFTDAASFNILPGIVEPAINASVKGPNQKETNSFGEEREAALARSQAFQENHPIAANLGGLASFAVLPVVDNPLGSALLGGTANALSTWIGGGSAKDVYESGIEGVMMMGAMHQGTKIAGETAKAGTAGELSKLREAGRQNQKATKPVLLEPQSVADLMDQLAVPVEGKIQWLQAPSIIPNKVNTPEARYGLQRTLSQIAHDPASVPVYKVNSLKDMSPVGPVAEIQKTPTGYQAVLQEIGPNGAGYYVEPINNVADAVKFREALNKHHPDLGIFTHSDARDPMMSDNPEIFNALYKKPVKVSDPEFVSSNPDKTGAGRSRPITPRDEAPAGYPEYPPSVAMVNGQGHLNIYNLHSTAAHMLSLEEQNIMAIQTPQGTRYLKRLDNADPRHAIAGPFDLMEGVPSIEKVSRVPDSKLRPLTHNELRRVSQRAQSFRRVFDKETAITDNEMGFDNAEPGVDWEPPENLNPRVFAGGGDYTPTKYNEFGQYGNGVTVNRLTGKEIGATNHYRKWAPVDVHEEAKPQIGDKNKLNFDTPQERFDKATKRMADILSPYNGDMAALRNRFDSRYQNALGELNAAKVELEKAGGMGGGKPPEGPPPTIPTAEEPPPPNDPANPPPPQDKPIWDLLAKVRKAAGKSYNLIQRNIQPPMLRAEFDLGNTIQDLKASQDLAKAQTAGQRAFERGLGWNRKRIDAFRERAYDWANGKITDETMAKEFPEAWNKKRDMMRDWEKMRDAQDATIRELGGIPKKRSPSDVVKLNKYVTRSYIRETATPKARLKMVLADVDALDKGVKGFQEWSKNNKNKTLPYAEARGQLIDALGGTDPDMDLFGEGKTVTVKNPTNNLRKRLDLPDWYLELLGENRDGFYAMSLTDAVQKSTIAHLTAWKAVAENPLRSAASREELAQRGLPQDVIDEWQTLPNNKLWYGKSAGRMVSPEVYDSMVTIPNAHYESNKLAAMVIKVQKHNWFSLGRMRTYMATFMDNWFYGLMAGGVDPTRPVASLKAMHYINKAMWEYRKNPYAPNEYAAFIRDMRRMGGDDPGHIGSDLSSQARRQEQYYLEKMASRTKFQKGYADWANDFTDLIGNVAKPGSAAFEMSDRWHKLASVKMIQDDLMRKPTVLRQLYHAMQGATAPEGITNTELARRIAVRQMMEFFPMYGHGSPAANFLSHGGAGIAAPTAKFAMERNRVYGNLPANILKSDAIKLRLLKWGILGNALYGAEGAMRKAYGDVSDEEIAEAYQNQGINQKMFQPGVWALPFKVGGQVQLIDLTAYLGPIQYLQGDPSLSPVAKMLLTAGTAPFQQGMAGVAMDGLLNAGGIKTGPQDRPMVPGTNPWVNVAEKAAQKGAIPAIIPEAYNNFNATGLNGSLPRKQEPMQPSMAVARTMGAPVSQPPSFQAKVADDIGQIKQMQGYLVMAAQMKPDQRVGLFQAIVNWASENPTPERQKIMNAAKEGLKAAARDLALTGRLHEAAKGPRRIGVDKP